MTRDQKIDLFLDEILSSEDRPVPAEKDRPETTTIPIERLHPFPQQPYKVEDNKEMKALVQSIREEGILTPLLVRRMDGSETEYEVISGHRRLHAAGKAGLKSVPVQIAAMDRNAAAIALVDSNLHRERLLPSEKAFAYKMKMDAMKRQGRRTDLTSDRVGPKLTAAEIAESDSATQVKRFIRLTHLLPELLTLLDEGKVSFSVGVELSFLDKPAQRQVLDAIGANDCTPSYSQAVRLHRACTRGTLTQRMIERTLSEEKPNQKEQIRLRREDYAGFFPSHYSAAQIEQDIRKGLELLKRQRERDHEPER